MRDRTANWEHMDPVEKLAFLLKKAGMRATLDMERSTALPCYLCGDDSSPRDLLRVGSFICDAAGGFQRGDAVERPVCASCESDVLQASITL